MTGAGLPDFAAMQIELRTYAQVFEDIEPTNTPRARALGAIALTPTGNAQGAHNLLSLATGAKIRPPGRPSSHPGQGPSC